VVTSWDSGAAAVLLDSSFLKGTSNDADGQWVLTCGKQPETFERMHWSPSWATCLSQLALAFSLTGAGSTIMALNTSAVTLKTKWRLFIAIGCVL
jgi:hypothetical protein